MNYFYIDWLTFFFVSIFFLLLALAMLGIHLLKKIYLYFKLKKIKTNKVIIFWPSLEGKPIGGFARRYYWAGYKKKLPSVKNIFLTLFIFVTLFLFLFGWFGFLFAAGIIFLLAYLINKRAKKNIALFVSQLPGALDGLVDTLKAGYSLPQAVEFAARELALPAQNIFMALARAQELNVNFGEALTIISNQLNINEWRAAAEALCAQQALGGNIIPLLQEEAGVLRDQLNIEQEIKTSTAAGRMSGYLIAGLVPVVLIFFWLVSPAYITVLFYTWLGRVLFFFALALELVGFLWIRKVVRINY